MARRKTLKTDSSLIKVAQNMARNDGTRIQLLVADEIDRFALVIPGGTVSDRWAQKAFGLKGKRYDYGNHCGSIMPVMIWLFDLPALEEIERITPKINRLTNEQVIELLKNKPPVRQKKAAPAKIETEVRAT